MEKTVKKVLSYVLVIMFIVTLGISVGGVALADDALSATVKVNPANLSGPGTVAVTVTLKNTGDPITNAKLQYPSPTDSVIDLGSMTTGESKEHVNSSWNITEDMLGKDMSFKVSWTSGDGSTKSGTTNSIKIAKQDAKVSVTGSGSASATEVNSGDKVKFTFTFKNEGNVKVENAYLKAPPLNGGDKLGEDFPLDAGSTNTKTWSIPLTEDTTVKAVYTYAVNGSQKTYECDPVTVKVKKAEVAAGSMSATLTADKTAVTTADEAVVFDLTVKNGGTSDLKNIVAKDFDGNPVTLSVTTLKAGETATGKATLSVAGTGNYSFAVTAVDASGNNVNVQTNAVSVAAGTPDAAASPSAAASVDPAKVVKIDLGVSNTKLAEPGEVTAQIAIKNLISEELKNIVISAEATPMNGNVGASVSPDPSASATVAGSIAGGAGAASMTIGTLPSLAVGAAQSFDTTFKVEESANFVIKVSAELPDGTVVTAQTPVVPITVEKKDGGMPMWQILLIVIICAIGGVGGFLGYYLYKNKKRGKSSYGGGSGRNGGKPKPPYNSGSGSRPRPQQSQRNVEREYNDRQPRQESRPRNDDRARYEERPRQQMPRETLDPRPRQSAEPTRRPVQKPSNGNTRYGDRNKF